MSTSPSTPAKKNGFETFLSKVGSEAKKVVSFLIHKALPVATEVAQEAEPLVALAEPAVSPEFNLVVDAAAATEASYAVVDQQNGTGAQKMAALLSAVKTQLLPKLTEAGLDSAAADAKVEEYVQAVVTILNTFPASAPAAGQS